MGVEEGREREKRRGGEARDTINHTTTHCGFGKSLISIPKKTFQKTFVCEIGWLVAVGLGAVGLGAVGLGAVELGAVGLGAVGLGAVGLGAVE